MNGDYSGFSGQREYTHVLIETYSLCTCIKIKFSFYYFIQVPDIVNLLLE